MSESYEASDSPDSADIPCENSDASPKADMPDYTGEIEEVSELLSEDELLGEENLEIQEELDMLASKDPESTGNGDGAEEDIIEDKKEE